MLYRSSLNTFFHNMLVVSETSAVENWNEWKPSVQNKTKSLIQNMDDFIDIICKETGKKYEEGLTEILSSVEYMKYAVKILPSTLKPKKRKQIQFNIKSLEKSSMDIISIENASLSFEGSEKPILDKQSFGISKG